LCTLTVDAGELRENAVGCGTVTIGTAAGGGCVGPTSWSPATSRLARDARRIMRSGGLGAV